MKRLFLGIFSVFCLIILLIGTFNNLQIDKITQYQFHLQQVDELTQELLTHSEKIESRVANPESWDQLAANPSKSIQLSATFWDFYFRNSLEVLSNEIVQKASGKQHADILLTKDYGKIERLESSMITGLTISGFKEKGAIGNMRQIVHQLENENPGFKQRILSIRRHEKDFIMRQDLEYAQKLNAEIDTWKQSKDYPASMNLYQDNFNQLTKAISTVFIQRDGLYNSWKTKTRQQLADLRSLRKTLLIQNLDQTRQISEFNSAMHLLVFILGIVLSVIFTMRLSKSVVSLQKAMENYIGNDYENKEISGLHVPRNEFGKLIQHFIQLSHKINQDVKLLENRVERRTISLQSKNEELENKHQEILRSMRYAKDLQQSLMSDPTELKYLFHTYELFFQSKDLVGGDFYWSRHFTKHEKDLRFFALADCTGHGVPGALLSVMGMQALDEIIEAGILKPDEVLNALRSNVAHRLNRNNNRRHDGMDIAFISIDYNSGILSFAGAHMSAWILRKGNVIELKGQRMPVAWSESHNDSFTAMEWKLDADDQIFIFSDGICDQFGGANNKKWGKKPLREIVASGIANDCQALFTEITGAFHTWKGNEEQTDDCTLILIEPGITYQNREIRQKDDQTSVFLPVNEKSAYFNPKCFSASSAM